MTKKHIWAKLLIVALVIAMVCVVFAGCKEDDPPQTVTPPDEDTKGAEAVTELLGVVDDAVAAIGGIDNIGSLGTDAFVEVVVNDTKVRIDLDLSLDLLNETTAGTAFTEYANNGFGFTVTVNDKREFGVWYVDMATDKDSYVYLAGGGQQLKIDGLTLANVLAKYNVNANVAVGDKLTEALKGQTITDMAGDLAGTIASMLTIGYDNSNPNSKVFTLSVKELFNPEGLVASMLDGIFFDEETVGFDLKGILADAGIGLTSLSQLYTVLPDINLKVTGNYNNGVFESIGIGLDIAGKEDGIVLPGTADKNPDGFVLVESVPSTSVSATLGFKILTNSAAYDNVLNTVETIKADGTWREIGVLNFSAEAEVTLGKTKEDSNKYKVEISADINAAAVAAATFTKRVYYTDDAGNYIKKDGQPVYTDWFYLSDATDVFGESDDTDILDALLPNINNLYLKMQNVDNADDIFVIALTEKVTYAEGNMQTGKIFVKLAALNNIMSAFGLNLSDLLGDLSDTIMGLEGTVSLPTVIPAVMAILPGMIYKIPAEYAELGATKFQPVAPATATADEAATDGATDGATDTATDSGFSLNTVIDIVKKAIACLDTSKWESNSAITAKDTGDLTVGGAKLTFDMTATVLKNAATNEVNGAKVVFNAPLVADYQADIKDGENKIGTNKVYTSVNVPLLQIGGTGNLFKATVSVHQDKTVTYTTEDADHQNSDTDFDIYIGFDLLSIGYGCAPTEPIALEINDKTFVGRTGSLYEEGAGWSIAKADVK